MPLERLFSKDDTLSNPTTHSFEENVINCNIGIEVEPTMLKLSKALKENMY